MDFDRVAQGKKLLAGAAVLIGIIAFIYGTQTVLAFQPPT
jgi:hypothetical protein